MKSIIPSKISGLIEAPISKSIVQRKLIAEYLASNLRPSVLEDSSIDVVTINHALNLFKNFQLDEPIKLNESGFCLRTLPILGSLFNKELFYQGSESLFRRPFIDEFRSIGLSVNIINSNLISVIGSINFGVFHIDGSITSQLLTILLMVLPTLKSDSIIYVNNLKSKSYIDLTLDLLSYYSVKVVHSNYEVFHIKGSQSYKIVENYEEGDWSGASFIASAASIAAESPVSIKGLDINSVQADRKLIEIFDKCGVDYSYDRTNKLLIINRSNIKAFEYDFSDCPDLIPAIIPLAINSDSKSFFYGADRLKYKESNRIKALISEYAKCNIFIRYESNSMIVNPGKFISNEVDNHNDHRIAMSLAVSSLNSDRTLNMSNEFCVNKSYPKFWKDLELLGVSYDE